MNTIFVSEDPAEPLLRTKQQLAGRDIQRLPIASDLLIPTAAGHTLAINYWAASTFLHAIRAKELDSKMFQLSQISPWPYLIIRDSLAPHQNGQTLHDGKPTGWRWAAVQGAMLSIQEMGVGLISIRDESQLDDCLISLINRDRGPKRMRQPRELLWATPAEELLMSLPGIGEDRAEQLLRECGNAANALAAITGDDIKLSGIGPETKRKAREALGLVDDESIYIATARMELV